MTAECESEMTLAEWVAKLPEFHLARLQYGELHERCERAAAEIVRLRGEVERQQRTIGVLCIENAGLKMTIHQHSIAPAEAKGDCDATFAEWLATEMPAGTVIGNPKWWAERIARQYRVRCTPKPAGGGADTARAALAWVLFHHQGGSSPVGQPIRLALGMGAHDPLPQGMISEAMRYAARTGRATSDFRRTTPQAAQGEQEAEAYRKAWEAGHAAACEVGVRKRVEGVLADYTGADPDADFLDAVMEALQHRGDSRGGES